MRRARAARSLHGRAVASAARALPLVSVVSAASLFSLSGIVRQAAGQTAGPAPSAEAPRRSPPPPLLLAWKTATASPSPLAVEPRNAALQPLCGRADAALAEVALRSLQRQIDGDALAADEVLMALRAAGDPHVWPRAWGLSGGALDEADIAARMTRWLDGWRTLGVRRCAIARGARADGTDVVAAVAVDALADLEPLPTVARVGQWLTLEGRMLVPATSAKVVLLGPRGTPRTVVASLSGDRIRSSFAVDQPGAWLVQVLATVSTGPRPVLEAYVHAGVAPPDRFVRAPVPGEDAARGAGDDADALLRMVNAARAAEQLPPLVRDPDLDRLALEHSEEMRRTRTVGHDVGGGDPMARVAAAGVRARIAGENVASSTTLANAHRALWASPSHRGNLLSERFTRIGVAVVRGDGGSVWVTELFAG